MYRHALPPGFVLKSQKKAIEQAARADVISLEDFLEVEVRISHFVPYCLTLDISLP
jgi:zinc finger CCCH domain-containing protein 15